MVEASPAKVITEENPEVIQEDESTTHYGSFRNRAKRSKVWQQLGMYVCYTCYRSDHSHV